LAPRSRREEELLHLAFEKLARLGLDRRERYSLMSMIWCLRQRSQASLEML